MGKINQKLVSEYQKKGFVIENGSILCASSAFVNNFSALGRVFKCLKKGDQTKHIWEMVTQEEALKLANLIDPSTGKKYIKFARIPLERVPQFNAFLPHEQEVIEEVEVSKSTFKKKPELVEAKTPESVDDLDTEDLGDDEELTVSDSDDSSDSSDDSSEDENQKALDDLEEEQEKENPATSIERKELMAKTAKELHGLLNELGIEYKSSMKKEELVELILG